MKHEDLLWAMREALLDLPVLVERPESWRSLDVLYEEPRVQRLWMEHRGLRLYLHRIHSCSAPFYHPHPWPSCVLVVRGRQRVVIGTADKVAGTLDLTPGCCYTMTELEAHHSVNPIGAPSLSVMVTAAPWSGAPALSEEQRRKNVPLADADILGLLADFASSLPEVHL